jgi:hypothetical protein
MNEELKYELVSDDGTDQKVVATFWWDGKKTCCDKKSVLNGAEYKHPLRYRADSLQFFKTLNMVYKHPSLYLRKKQKDD